MKHLKVIEANAFYDWHAVSIHICSDRTLIQLIPASSSCEIRRVMTIDGDISKCVFDIE